MQMKAFNRAGQKLLTLPRREMIAAYVFMLPALLFLVIFTFTPMFNAIWISLHKWDLIGDMTFIGLDNFRFLLSSTDWWTTLRLTFTYAVCFVSSLFIVSLILALIVKHIIKFTGFFRTSYFVPIVLSSVAAGIIWKLLFDEKFGAINLVVKAFGGIAIPWLARPNFAFIAVLIVHVWLQMGYYMIIFLAGLQDIPVDYYEAGTLDGASGWQLFIYITFPCLSDTSIFVLVMGTIISFQAYDQVKLLTDGGPANSTRFAVQYIYEHAFRLYQMGRAAAMSLILFVFILAISIVQIKVASKDKQ